MNKLKRGLLIVAGFTLIGLGTVGVFIPVLPTTPLYLLALFCFANSSERIKSWYEKTWFYKRYLANYMQTRSLTVRTKLGICIPVTGMLAVTAFLIDNALVRALIIVLALSMHFCFIFVIKTSKAQPSDNDIDSL